MLDRYIIGDARDLASVVAAGSVQLTITSPPYGHLKDYGGLENQIGHGQRYEEYLRDLRNVFKQVHDVSKPDGTLWVVIDTFRQDGEVKLLPFDFAGELGAVGWTLADIVIWHKTKTLPWSRKGQVRNIFEYILFFTKSRGYKYRAERITEPADLKEWWVKYPERYAAVGKVPDNIWEFTIPTQGSWSNADIKHACPFPFALIQRVIDLCSDEGDVILDPFAGTGSVLAQASCMRRRYLGLDLNPTYRTMFEEAVLPECRRQWMERVLERGKRADARAHLITTIPKLRQLKYCKQLIRELSKDERSCRLVARIEAIVAIGQDSGFRPSKERYLNETVLVIAEALTPEDRQVLSELAGHVGKKPPLSKFGIDADVRILGPNEAEAAALATGMQETLFSLYTRGQVWWAADAQSVLSEWLEEMRGEDWHVHRRNGVPPILSNIRVQQKIPKK